MIPARHPAQRLASGLQWAFLFSLPRRFEAVAVDLSTDTAKAANHGLLGLLDFAASAGLTGAA